MYKTVHILTNIYIYIYQVIIMAVIAHAEQTHDDARHGRALGLYDPAIEWGRTREIPCDKNSSVEESNGHCLLRWNYEQILRTYADRRIFCRRILYRRSIFLSPNGDALLVLRAECQRRDRCAGGIQK